MTNSEVFEKVKAIFDTIAKEATCNFCQEIIWNSPIYESTGGFIACEKCLFNKCSLQENFNRIFKLEKALLAFETDCKYKINGCDFDGGPHNIILHEEDCKFRMVYCPIFRKCKEKYQFHKLFEHLKLWHGNIHNELSKKVDHNKGYDSVYCGNFSIPSRAFVGKYEKTKAFICDNNFVIQMQFNEEKQIALIWVRLMESKFQAKHINYKIEVQGPENKVFYEGSVRNIDEKIQDIFNSQIGLALPFAIIKKCLQEERLHFCIVIKNLKSNEDLTLFESENSESEEPPHVTFCISAL